MPTIFSSLTAAPTFLPLFMESLLVPRITPLFPSLHSSLSESAYVLSEGSRWRASPSSAALLYVANVSLHFSPISWGRCDLVCRIVCIVCLYQDCMGTYWRNILASDSTNLFPTVSVSEATKAAFSGCGTLSGKTIVLLPSLVATVLCGHQREGLHIFGELIHRTVITVPFVFNGRHLCIGTHLQARMCFGLSLWRWLAKIQWRLN